MKKKLVAIGLAAAVMAVGVGALAGCGETADGSVINKAIIREAGSGTRSAFEELVKGSDGTTIAKALEGGKTFAACVSESSATSAVISKVSGRYDTLGYISMGSLAANKDAVEAVSLNGVAATTANVVNGTYTLSRPFNIVYKSYDGLNDLAKNFIDFIESEQIQTVIEEKGYIKVEGLTVKNYTPYAGTLNKLKIDGSTSVQPLMNVIAEEFEKLNSGVTVEVEGGGSGAGIADASGGTVDIGMSSRNLKATETGLESRKIADDGIAVIVKKGSKCTNVTSAQLYDLYLNGTAIETK